MRAALQASAGKKEKKGKRKNGEAVVGPEDGEGNGPKRPSPPSKPVEDGEEAAATKRRRTEEHSAQPQDSINGRSDSPPSATAAVAASIAAMAAREAKAREKPLSANVLKGIYGK